MPQRKRNKLELLWKPFSEAPGNREGSESAVGSGGGRGDKSGWGWGQHSAEEGPETHTGVRNLRLPVPQLRMCTPERRGYFYMIVTSIIDLTG